MFYSPLLCKLDFYITWQSGVLIHSLMRAMNFLEAHNKQKRDKLHWEPLWAIFMQETSVQTSVMLPSVRKMKNSHLSSRVFVSLFFKFSSISVVLPTAPQIHQRFRCLSRKINAKLDVVLRNLLTARELDQMTLLRFPSTQTILRFYDKDLKNLPLYCQEKQNFIFFSRKVNHADVILSLFIDVSNNIPKRSVCRASHGIFLLITIQVKEVWI